MHHPCALMRPRDRRLQAGIVVLSMLLLAVLVHGAGVEALLAAPAFVLLAPLLAGRYLGERQIERLAAARVPHPRRATRPSATSIASRAPRVLLPRGGRLLATSLAVRPPPLHAQLT
jgi:hypothetical protein